MHIFVLQAVEVEVRCTFLEFVFVWACSMFMAHSSEMYISQFIHQGTCVFIACDQSMYILLIQFVQFNHKLGHMFCKIRRKYIEI
jgi:hypothetical protein